MESENYIPGMGCTCCAYGNALYVFLFLWGHEWWVLALWWGLILFPIVVIADEIYGTLRYEIFNSQTNAIGEARADNATPNRNQTL